jgi:hypothetical protein
MLTSKNFKLLPLAFALATILSGCATGVDIPDTIDSNYDAKKSQNKIIEEWNSNEQTISYVDRGGDLMVESPWDIPERILSKPVDLEFSTESTLTDLAAFLKDMGIFTIIPESELASKKIVMFSFKGTLGEYLNSMSIAYGISFNWNEGDIMTVEKSSMYMVRIPQDEELMKALATDIGNLGAKSAKYSMYSGLITYEASKPAQRQIIKYLERSTINAAMITTQVAIITVQLNKERNVGIDWNELGMNLGNQKLLDSDEDSTSSSNNSNNSDNSDSSDSTNSTEKEESPADIISALGSNLRDSAGAGKLSGTGSNFRVAKGDFSLSAAINYLSLYGETETDQSVLMKTLSGSEVKLKSGQKIPYVDSVGVSTGTSDSSVDSNSLGSVNIKEIDVGLELTLTPYFEEQSSLVTTEVELSLSSLLGFIELSAGNQVGTVTRPNTQTQEFNDIVKIAAGESVLIGGITYSSRSDKRNAPAFLEKAGVSASNVEISKNAMFILLRPSVTIFGNYPELSTRTR